MAKRARAGDADASERLVCANLRFVVSVAKKYQHLGVPLADLINEGNIGLMRAARRFDETKGVKFISYAVWWIRQAVFQALAEHSRPVRLPVGMASEWRRRRAEGREVGALGSALSLDAPVTTTAPRSSSTSWPTRRAMRPTSRCSTAILPT